MNIIMQPWFIKLILIPLLIHVVIPVAEEIAKRTETTIDDTVVAGIKNFLNDLQGFLAGSS